MPRHRGQFNPENPAPYELSRSRIENFVKCPACFYLQQVKKTLSQVSLASTLMKQRMFY